MSISSIFTQAGSAVAPASTYQDPLTASTPQTISSTNSASISPMGALMAQLQQMSTSNPSQFQQVTASIAAQLQQAAGQGGSANGFLSNLADKFQTASQTGSMAPLEPHGHHGGHRHGGGGGLQALLTSSAGGSASSAQTGASSYSQNSRQSLFSQVLSIIGQAVSGQSMSGSAQTSA